MTRDEAIKEFYAGFLGRWRKGSEMGSWGWCDSVVGGLERLGLIKLTPQEDKDQVTVARYLTGNFIQVVRDSGGFASHKITDDGAYEIIDILTKSGFKITKEPT